MKLIKPTFQYEKSWLAALKEYKNAKRKVFWDSPAFPTDLASYIKQTQMNENGENLPPNIMPTVTFWLIDNNEYIGHLILRPQLNDKLKREGGHIGYAIRPAARGKGYGRKILKLGIKKAKELSIPELLITCDDNNIPSIRVIESNGGHLIEKATVNNKLIRRYVIKIN